LVDRACSSSDAGDGQQDDCDGGFHDMSLS
jgi:hypothetical protein